MLKTAEEIAREIVDNRMKPSFGPHCVPDELKIAIEDAILADRKQRDERVIEVLETLYAVNLNDTNCASFDVANRRIRAVVYPLLAELRKEKE